MRRVTFVLGAIAAAACAGPDSARAPGPEGGLAEAATAAVLGESTALSAPVRVQIAAARRVAPDTIRIDLVLVSQVRPGDTDEASRDAVQKAVAGLAAASVVSADGRRRLFPLQDASGRPVTSALAAPEPGGRRSAWLLFAGHPRDGGPITLVLPGFPPFRRLPVI